MKNNINWDLMIMYLEGSCSEEDERKVLEWKAESQENRNEFELLKNLWDTKDLTLPKVDVEKSLQVVNQRIRNYSDHSETQKSKIFKSHHKKKLSQLFLPNNPEVLVGIAHIFHLIFQS